jgi:hypothetical protein
MDPIFRCPQCKSEYDNEAAAEACSTIPIWPTGTQLLVKGAGTGWASSELWIHEGDESRMHKGSKCVTFSRLRLHPLFRGHGKWSKHGGVCLLNHKEAHNEPGACMYRPLKIEDAVDTILELKKTSDGYRREIAKIEKKRVVLQSFIEGNFGMNKK